MERQQFRIGLTPFEQALLLDIIDEDLDECWQLELQVGKPEVFLRRLLLKRIRRNLTDALTRKEA